MANAPGRQAAARATSWGGGGSREGRLCVRGGVRQGIQADAQADARTAQAVGPSTLSGHGSRPTGRRASVVVEALERDAPARQLTEDRGQRANRRFYGDARRTRVGQERLFQQDLTRREPKI